MEEIFTQENKEFYFHLNENSLLKSVHANDEEMTWRILMPPEKYTDKTLETSLSIYDLINDQFPETVSTKTQNSEDTCPICLESIKEGDIFRVLFCKHKFHINCIDFAKKLSIARLKLSLE